MIKEIEELKKQVIDLNSNNRFLLSQQQEIKKRAELAGTNEAKVKHDLIRAEDKLETALNKLKYMKGDKN